MKLALNFHTVNHARFHHLLQKQTPCTDNFSVSHWVLHCRNRFPNGPIGRIPAYDLDESDRDSLEYRIISGNEAPFVYLEKHTGLLALNKALDNDRPTNGSFIVQASGKLTS